jgi:hypothetical protein
LHSGGKLRADKPIQCDAAKPVLKLKVGDEVRLDEKGFMALRKAFFTEIGMNFSCGAREGKEKPGVRSEPGPGELGIVERES